MGAAALLRVRVIGLPRTPSQPLSNCRLGRRGRSFIARFATGIAIILISAGLVGLGSLCQRASHALVKAPQQHLAAVVASNEPPPLPSPV